MQQNILSAHQVLKALAEQRRRRKFIPLLLVDLGALADHRALHYCSIAEQDFVGFLDILLREDFISKNQCGQIQEAWMRSGPRLGRLLVEMGFIDEQTRAEVLEEFEAEKSLMENLAKIS